ncbi:MAG TPA: site-2 protease family protein, partial [Blastocatellia bacterium]|nr:site-2 protease family protein [Blastocatellia bacterium]
MENADQPYLFPEVQLQRTRDEFTRTRRESELTGSRILLHSALLIATGVTTMLTGAALSIPVPDDSTVIGSVVGPLIAVLTETVSGNLEPLAKGLLFTFTLLTILGAHELGHYFACRYYGIRATLPFFIPAPPAITLFGTFGAVIKIKAPISSRRALFDIGIAGPLAGFAFALPASVIGLVFAKAAMPADTASLTGAAQFHDPLLFIVITDLLGLPKWIEWNPIYWAAWGTLLVTALNLFPVGQLDGGHVLYALVGRQLHKWVSALTAVAVVSLAALAFYLHQPPVYFLWALVLLFLLKVGHPPVIDEAPLGKARVAL